MTVTISSACHNATPRHPQPQRSPRPRGGFFPLVRAQVGPPSRPLHRFRSTACGSSLKRTRSGASRAGQGRAHAPLQQRPSRGGQGVGVPSRRRVDFPLKDRPPARSGGRSHISHLAFGSTTTREDGQTSRSRAVPLGSFPHRPGSILGKPSTDIVPAFRLVDLEPARRRVQRIARFTQGARRTHQ